MKKIEILIILARNTTKKHSGYSNISGLSSPTKLKYMILITNFEDFIDLQSHNCLIICNCILILHFIRKHVFCSLLWEPIICTHAALPPNVKMLLSSFQ